MKFNIKEIVRPHLKNIRPYQSNRDVSDKDQSIFLDANENPNGEYRLYPDSNAIKLKSALSIYTGCASAQVFLGNGSDELIDQTIRLFCEPGKDAVLILEPTFGMYRKYAEINNVEVQSVPLNNNFQIETDVFSAAVKRSNPKVLFLCSPNNPTGNCLANIEWCLESFDGIVVVDEAYIEFVPEKSVVPLLSKYPNLIVLRTFSKAWGLAGLRLGYGIASEEVATCYNTVHSPYNINAVAQNIALKRLKEKAELYKGIEQTLNEKVRLQSALSDFTFVKKVYPSDTNFILVKFSDAARVYHHLNKNKISTSLRHPEIENCLRITIGNLEENNKLLEILSLYK